MPTRVRTMQRPARTPVVRRLPWLIASATFIGLALFVSPAGRDPFRVPKLLLLRGAGIALIALALTAGWPRIREMWRERDRYFIVALMMIGWTVIATAMSKDVWMSVPSVLTALAGIAIFFAARDADNPGRAGLAIIFSPAVIVAMVAVAQMNDALNHAITSRLIGIVPDLNRYTPTSLLGNRTDVGIYLVAPLLVATAWFLAENERRTRIVAVAIIATLAAGVIASTTITALGTIVVALFALALLRSPRIAAVCVLVAVALTTAAALWYPPLQRRASALQQNIQRGQWDAVITYRLVAFFATTEMIARDPLTGIGPGVYRREYFDHKIIAAQKHRDTLPTGGSRDVFEEAHNDHLHITAETGVIGYAIALIAASMIARLSFRRAGPGVDTEMARLLALPLVLSLAILGMAQSPLQIAATIGSYSYLAGLCVRWSSERRASVAATVNKAVAASVALAAAAALLFFIVEPYRANIAKRDVAIATNSALQPQSQAGASEIASANLQRLHRHIRGSTRDAELYILRAANYRILRRYDEAIAAYDAALRIEPTALVFVNRGVTQLAAGREEDAWASFTRAFTFDPSLRGQAAEAIDAYRRFKRR